MYEAQIEEVYASEVYKIRWLDGMDVERVKMNSALEAMTQEELVEVKRKTGRSAANKARTKITKHCESDMKDADTEESSESEESETEESDSEEQSSIEVTETEEMKSINRENDNKSL